MTEFNGKAWCCAADLPCGGAWVGQLGWASDGETLWARVQLIGFERRGEHDRFICQYVDGGGVARFRRFVPAYDENEPPSESAPGPASAASVAPSALDALAARVSRLELLVEGLRQIHQDDGR